MSKQKIESKREREKRTVALMIRLYCKKKHGTNKTLCPECEALTEYAMMRSDKCPFMETKTFALTAVFIATNAKCERKSERSCVFRGLG